MKILAISMILRWGGWTLFGSGGGPALRKQTLPNNLQFHTVYCEIQVTTDIADMSENCNSTLILPSHPTIVPIQILKWLYLR